ncbi:MAG TPA: helix-turn-helix domain-containing protein [Methanocella sp.]|nr:helix-turn-helix domain-containing protein [Methanocella sp.]
MEQHFDEKALSKLGMLGLTEYEAKVYLTLLLKGSEEASKVSRHSGIPRPHTYSVLKSMQARGLVLILPGSINRYQAVPLDKGLDLLLREKKRQFLSLKQTRDTLLSEIRPHEAIPSEGQAIIMLYHGNRNIYRLMDEMFQRCEDQAEIITTSRGIVRFNNYFADATSRLSGKKISMKLIASMTPEINETALNLPRLVKLRRIDTPPPIRFVLIDGKEVLFVDYPEDHLTAETGKETGIWTNQSNIAGMMKTLFNETWKNAITYS